MTKELVNKERNEYRFVITDNEAVRRIHECLVKTNPELKESDIYRSKYSKEFKAGYHRSDGEDVSISVGIPNLKRYFGAFILGFEENGLNFIRRVPKKSKNTN